MIVEISVAVIAAAFVILTVFLVMTLLRIRSSIQSVQKDLHHFSSETLKLAHNVDELTTDIKKKSASLDFLFRSLNFLNKEKSHRPSQEEKVHTTAETIAEIIDWAAISIDLFNQIKGYIKHHGKSKQ